MSPHLAGKRVDLATWQAVQPVRPLFGLDGTTVLNADLVQESEERQSAEQWVREENDRRAALMLTGNVSVPDVTVADWPGREDLTSADSEASRRRARYEKQRQAIIAATGEDPGLPATRSPDGDRFFVPGTNRTSVTAETFSKQHGMPNHKPTRPSQRPGARTKRDQRRKARLKAIRPAPAVQQAPAPSGDET